MGSRISEKVIGLARTRANQSLVEDLKGLTRTRWSIRSSANGSSSSKGGLSEGKGCILDVGDISSRSCASSMSKSNLNMAAIQNHLSPDLSR